VVRGRYAVEAQATHQISRGLVTAFDGVDCRAAIARAGGAQPAFAGFRLGEIPFSKGLPMLSPHLGLNSELGKKSRSEWPGALPDTAPVTVVYIPVPLVIVPMKSYVTAAACAATVPDSNARAVPHF
jgi:hypothetical protein